MFQSWCRFPARPKLRNVRTMGSRSGASSDIMAFPRGSLLVEAQALLLDILHRAVTKISEITKVMVTNSQCARRPRSPIVASRGDWSHITERPFRTPLRFNLDMLRETVNSRADTLNGHLWLLQTDQTFTKQYMLQLDQMKCAQMSSDKDLKATVV